MCKTVPYIQGKFLKVFYNSIWTIWVLNFKYKLHFYYSQGVSVAASVYSLIAVSLDR